FGAEALARKGNVWLGLVDRGNAAGRTQARQGQRDAARATADVQDTAVGRQIGKADEGLGEALRPAAEEPFIGRAVAGVVAGGRRAHRLSPWGSSNGMAISYTKGYSRV